jgi:hypothetical protein
MLNSKDAADEEAIADVAGVIFGGKPDAAIR